MSVRVTQQFTQYVADVNTEADLRVTQVFAQAIIAYSKKEIFPSLTSNLNLKN